MDAINYLKFLVVLVLVIGLILALAAGLKRLGFASSGAGLGRKRRLAMVESTMLDGRHRLVLVRRDAIEHLLLVGPNTSQVIETGIPSAPAGEIAENPSFLSAFGQVLAKEKQP